MRILPLIRKAAPGAAAALLAAALTAASAPVAAPSAPAPAAASPGAASGLHAAAAPRPAPARSSATVPADCPVRAPSDPPPAPSSPGAVLRAFDSLLEAGDLPAARRLCAGPMLRLFDFVALAQGKLAGLVDTCRSHEKTLEEKTGADWAYVKSAGVTVFRRPFMGQDSLASVQAAHLYRTGEGWRLAEVEELSGRDAPVRLRSGPLPMAAAAGGPKDAGAAPAGLFPVSPLAPASSGQADRLRMRVNLRDGSRLDGMLPLGAAQTRVRARSPSDWTLEIRRVAPGKTAPAPGPAPVLSSADDARWLESNAFLVLSDSLLRATADSVAGRERDPERIASAIYRWVTERFRFKLGAVLFGTSAEVLRSLTGDCSEAAVLTAALLRARGVPARIALGFASVGRGVFIGHAWCEARLGGAWVGVDAALREFPAGAERVKLAELDGREDLRIAATNLMMRAIGNLDLRIEAAWRGNRALPLRRFEGNAAEAESFFQDILDGASDSGRAP